PLERVDHGEIPLEEVDAQFGARAHQRVEERTEGDGQAVVGRVLSLKLRAAVEVPAEDPDRMAGGQHRRAHRAEVVGNVDDHGGTRGLLDSPDVATGLEERRAGKVFGRAHVPTRATSMPGCYPPPRPARVTDPI